MITAQRPKTERTPLSAPVMNGMEWRNIKECLDTGWVSSAGGYIEKFEDAICRSTKARHAVACVSGTAALQVALQIADVREGDEVIVPTVTFIAPVNTVRYRGADPVFMDCDDYYNIDTSKTAAFLREETKMVQGHTYNKRTQRRVSAIVPVHVYGNAVGLDPLIPLCREKNIKVIEDATESLGTRYKRGKYKGKFTGTIGDIGCYSFNGNKIITTGGGGMIVTQNAKYADRARYLTTQAKDDPVRFIHNEVGYNFRLNNLQAAMGVAQLGSLFKIIAIKKENYALYKRSIDRIPGLVLADTPAYAENNFWMYALQINVRQYGRTPGQLMKLFQVEGIETRPLWYLNHLQKPYKGCQAYKIRNALKMLDRTLNIPCSADLSRQEILRIVGLLKKWKR